MNAQCNPIANLVSIYTHLGHHPTDIIKESEGTEYCAHQLMIGTKRVVYRKAKITPTKTGLFVTLWKRNKEGITAPYDTNDNFDICIVDVSENGQFGQFIFTKNTLLEHDVISHDNQGGKRAIRVYPSWCTGLNKQATKTQNWQKNHFFETADGVFTNPNAINRLFS